MKAHLRACFGYNPKQVASSVDELPDLESPFTYAMVVGEPQFS